MLQWAIIHCEVIGERLTVDVESTYTIHNIKEKVQQQIGTPPLQAASDILSSSPMTLVICL